MVLPCQGPLEGVLRENGARIFYIDPVVFRRDILSPRKLIAMAGAAVRSVIQLRRLIVRNKYDLVHSNTGVIIGGALAARLAGIPHIWHFREILSEFRQLWTIFEPFVLHTSREIFCISDAVAQQFKSKKASEKITVIYDGIVVPERPPVHRQKNNSEPFHVLSVGRIAPYKGQDVLIRALGSLLDRGFDVRLTLVGDVYGERVSYRESLESIAVELEIDEYVEFAGFSENIEPFFANADVFVLSSTRPEGLGLVVLEAMAAGTPVVASNNGALKEIIDDNKNGLLVEPGDHQAIADAIEEIIRDPELRRRLAEAGFERVAEKFTVEEMNRNIVTAYRQALSGK